MTLEQILRLPTSEIERNGQFFLTVIREWRRLTGKEPSLCGCDGRANINYVKRFYEQKIEDPMKPNIFFQMNYYHSDTITEAQKQQIKEANPTFYASLAEKYGWNKVERVEKKPKTKKK